MVRPSFWVQMVIVERDRKMHVFEVSQIASGVRRIVDVLGDHAYLVEGCERALLVDCCAGLGDLRACVEDLSALPVEVVLTHSHYDHMAGSYWFDQVRISPLEGDRRLLVEDHAQRVFEQLTREGVYPEEAAFAIRDGARPELLPVEDGDIFDLGGRVVRAVALPGHTAGSMGYLVEDCGVLLSGDSVTPITCLFSDDSLSIQGWRDETLARMAELPFERFYTGHHDHAFAKVDLASFDAAGEFALGDRGMQWSHNRLQEFRGVIHLCPCDTIDTNSVDFRAIIERWHELLPRRRGSRHSRRKEA